MRVITCDRWIIDIRNDTRRGRVAIFVLELLIRIPLLIAGHMTVKSEETKS